MKEILNNQRGVSILFAIFMLLVLGLLMAALVGLLSNKSLSSAEELVSSRALFLAETGVELAITENLPAGTNNNYSYQDGNIQVSIISLGVLDGNNILQVDSLGTIGDIKRKLRVKYRQ